MFMALVLGLLGAVQSPLVNSGFEQGLAGWTTGAGKGVTVSAAPGDVPAARMEVSQEADVGYPQILQEFPLTPGSTVTFSGRVRCGDVRDGAGPYLCVEYQDAAKVRLGFEQSAMTPRDGDWHTLQVVGIAPKKTVSAKCCMVLNGRGWAELAQTEADVTPGPPMTPPDGPATLTVTNAVACDKLIGFGAEDDGWFYNQENRSKGVDDADYVLREGRIDWLDPDWVRMFFWFKDWNPSGDWATFDFDTDNMRSHYRTLDQYQRLGAAVNVVDVEWGVAKVYAEPPKVAKAIGALLEHLIKDRGYTCITEWTLTNEPNGFFVGSGFSFDTFVELHRLVKQEIDARGLKVRIVGSDDTDGFKFFKQCIDNPEYYGLSDYFASHRYIQHASRPLLSVFLDDRLGMLAARTPRKPLIVAEFGFHDARSGALDNPVMDDYDYAIWTSAFVIDGLNKGVAGYSIWCLHETYYPGNGFMNYGLWKYNDNGWKPRPVYHAWAPFTRFTNTGDAVRRCDSTHPAYVSGAYAADTLFWVNQHDQSVEVTIQGVSPKTVRVMTEANLQGDRDCGDVVALKEGLFTAPPMSFGYAR